MKKQVDIRPTTGVYATYKRLSYEPWNALAEFVDNSTQSYFDNNSELKSRSDFKKLYVEIKYEHGENGNDILIITDNAYGMEIEDFERALILNKPPKNKNGRNEFGMGLKTAACWFGNKWSIKTSRLGSKYGYIAQIDVDDLKKNEPESIDMDMFEDDENSHYTEIRIENLNKKITSPRTIGKVKEYLSSIYRNDLRQQDIVILYNGESLSFKDPTVYKEELEGGKLKEWKQEINFFVEHNGEKYNVNGFIAIRMPASVRDAGFVLLRRGRVIVGGGETNYRPKELFGDSNSYAYQRLFGELNMDEWPVTQAKDQFDWHSDGLEDKFITELEKFTKCYKEKAESIRVREKVNTIQYTNNMANQLENSTAITDLTVEPVELETLANDINTDDTLNEDEIEEISNIPNNSDSTPVINGPKIYEWSFVYQSINYHFTVEFVTEDWANWLIFDKNTNNIKINMKHPFFKPLIDNVEFGGVMGRFCIAFILAELKSIQFSSDSNNRIEASEIRMKMNEILKELVQGNE